MKDLEVGNKNRCKVESENWKFSYSVQGGVFKLLPKRQVPLVR